MQEQGNTARRGRLPSQGEGSGDLYLWWPQAAALCGLASPPVSAQSCPGTSALGSSLKLKQGAECTLQCMLRISQGRITTTFAAKARPSDTMVFLTCSQSVHLL